jgi:putative membrane protein
MTGLERLALTDRELMAAVDDQAKTAIAQSARRVSVVTAITPFALIDMAYVLYESLRMLSRVAGAYGGRPGLAGLFRLGARVVGHVIATGGVALTDDLLGQFIGQGLAKRLSARAGQGMFNGALMARLGVAAIDLCRPLPFIEARRPRFRDLALEVARGLSSGKAEPESGSEPRG